MVSDDDSEGDRPFWSRPGFILAGVLIAGVAVLGIILGLTVGNDDEPTPAQRSVTAPADAATPSLPPDDATATTNPPSTPEPAAAADCPQLPGGDPEAALTTGPEVQWSPVGEVAAALSEDHGPATREGIKSCYAPTSTGALLAAYNFLADLRTWSTDPTEVVQLRVSSASPDYAELLSQATAARSGDPLNITVVGYRFAETATDRHTIILVQRIPGQTEPLYATDRLTVEWMESDWKVTSISDPEQVDSLPPGYTEWGPEAGNRE